MPEHYFIMVSVLASIGAGLGVVGVFILMGLLRRARQLLAAVREAR